MRIIIISKLSIKKNIFLIIVNNKIDHYLCNIIAAYENIKLCLKHNLNKQANELIDKLFVIHSYIKKQLNSSNNIYRMR